MTEPIMITVAEQTLAIRHPGLSIFREAAERVRNLRRAEFDDVLAGCRALDGEALSARLSRAIEHQQRIITDSDILDWLQSPAGEAFLFWRSAREHQPDLDEDAAARLFASLDSERIEQLAVFLSEGLNERHSTSEVTS